MFGFRRKKKEEPIIDPVEPKEMKISRFALDQVGQKQQVLSAYNVPEAAPGVIPSSAKMALDSSATVNFDYASMSTFGEGLGFMGYPYLSELAQRAEYRRPCEILAKEMTREWITIVSTGNDDIDDKTDKIKEIEAEFERLKVKETFYKAIEQDALFGRSQIYLDTGATDKPDELIKPLSESAAKISKGGLKGLVNVEPMWTYPNKYNSIDPLKNDYFVPSEWFVMGKQVHSSRLLTFVFRKVPDILKPAYVFGGISLAQMMKPYVDNWLRTRQSVSDLVHSFTVFGLKTNMGSILNGGAATSLINRVQLFADTRDNRNMALIDKDSEEIFNISASLGTLDQLQAQSQEHMAAVSGIPLIKLLGITPSGLNASSDGEIRSFYDWCSSQQEANLTPNLRKLLNIIQLSLFGEIDPEISFVWNPLWTMDDTETANVRRTDADTDINYINAGVISPEEVRQRLASEKESLYASLDTSIDALDLPEEGEELPVFKSRSSNVPT